MRSNSWTDQPHPMEAPAPRAQEPRERPGFALGRLSGIELRVDWSLLFIFGLIAIDLGAGVFPRWHPDWGAGLCWAVALAAATAFFASVLAHELAHALMARRHGIAVPRITLFLFGGVAELAEEPRTPRAELLIAVVGPLMSLLVGGAALLGAGLLASPDLPSGSMSTVESVAVVEQLGPITTLLFWLGPVNIVLAVFNMIPGFPLDGGRVLRAILWWITGNATKSTRWAARSGQVVAVLMMGLGVVLALAGDFAQGMWLVLLGWFLHRAAASSVLRTSE